MLDLIHAQWGWSSRTRRNNHTRRRRVKHIRNAIFLVIGILVVITQQRQTSRHLFVSVHELPPITAVQASGISDASVLILQDQHVDRKIRDWNIHADVTFSAAERLDRKGTAVASPETDEIAAVAAAAKAYATDDATVIRVDVGVREKKASSEQEEHVAIPTGVARFPNGTLGYIADPTALRNHIQGMLPVYRSRVNQNGTFDQSENYVSTSTRLDHYWAIVGMYRSEFSYQQSTASHRDQWIDNNATVPTSEVVISADMVCADAPGMGMEGGMGAYQLVTQKIKVHTESLVNNHHLPSPRPIKVLCAMYTHVPRQFSLVRSAALTWGTTCDGFVAFANATIPALGLVDLVQVGPQAYGNMWQKTRSIWRYIYLHYLDEYDYFHLSGDDVYVIVPNLRHFLQRQHEKLQKEQGTLHPELYAGQWVRQKHRPYLGGGPGYTLSRATLRRFMESGVWHTCQTHTVVSYEDRLLSQCLSKLLEQPSSVDFWVDTREVGTGAQQYLGSPQQVFESRPPDPRRPRRASFYSRLVAYWESLPYPQDSTNGMTNESLVDDHQTTQQPMWRSVPPNETAVGPRHGLDAAGTYSVAFHQIRHPLFQARIHTLLYPHLCHETTALGKARQTTDD